MAGNGAAQSTYTNPVLQRPQGVADPFILKHNGEYYLYATGNPIMAYHSTDLVNWTEIGPVLSGSSDPGAWNQTDVWAPEVVYRNGKFYLYYSATRRAPNDWRVEEEARRVGVAVGDSPRGPFVDSGSPVTPGWAIDGHVFRDPSSGKEYLFFSYLYEPELPGAGQVVDSLVTPFRTAGTPSHVIRGSEYWEDKDADPSNGSLRYTNEAPTVIHRHGINYMIYSGGSWDLPTYAMGYAYSPWVMQGGLDGPGWVKVVPPFLRATPLVEGPGHNTVVKAPNNVDDIVAYHGREVPFLSPGDRQTFLDRLYWNNDRIFMLQPTLGARPAPDRPLFADRFDRAGGTLGGAWDVSSGSWRTVDGQAQGTGLALPRTEPLNHYVFEANVRIPGSGSAGVAAYHADANNRVDVLLDARRRVLRTTGVLGGRAIPEVSTPLPADFRFDAYHQILVTKNAGDLRVDLDGVHRQRHSLAMSEGRAGIQARGGRADFDGIALTAHYEDTFADPEVAWEARGGTWLVDEGALHQVAGTSGLALKGDPAVNYEFQASVRVRDSESVTSRVGIVAAAGEAGEMVVAGFDRTIWPFARFWVQHIRGTDLAGSLAVEMPRGFRYEEFHTIRVVKQGDGFTFYLDGREIAAAHFPIGLARPGLYTQAARAAFDNASMKHLVTPQNLLLNGSFEAERWEVDGNAVEDPWQLSGAARINVCCAYEGQGRLLLTGSDGSARQEVRGLEPGRYTLWAWVSARNGEAEVRVAPEGGAVRQATSSGEGWHRLELEFEVPQGQPSVTVSVHGRLQNDPRALVAADNLYLFRH